jgi:predicted phosphodiesterase
MPKSPSSESSSMPNTRLAVFSDVHANIEALQAVFADMEGQAVSRRVCLGDIVGYAANPAECLDLVIDQECLIVQGNHDEAAAASFALFDLRDMAERGIEFARRGLSLQQRAYLGQRPLTVSGANCQFVHASLNEPGYWQYITSESEAREHFKFQTEPLCFCGHTHKPHLWHLSKSGVIRSWPGEGCHDMPASGKTLVNVGSVGQPRDGSSAACYVICDPKDRRIEFRRVAYDIGKARQRIVRARLPRQSAERLTFGR